MSLSAKFYIGSIKMTTDILIAFVAHRLRLILPIYKAWVHF